MNEEIIKKLKNVDVPKEIKWIYTLSAYILKNQNDDKFYQKLQNRVNSTIRSHSGEYKKYISQQKYELSLHKDKERYKTNKKYREYHLEQQRIRRVAYKLYKDNKLSKESSIEIEKEIKNE